MTLLSFIAIAGLLFLCMSLASGWLSRGPFTEFSLYVIIGIICGPWIFDIIRIDIIDNASWVVGITDIAMAASLFITGLKLRQPFRKQAWRVGALLAFPAMLITVLSMTLIAHYLVGLSWSLSLAFGAIVAPTDPVLASLISVNSARDEDALRSSLSIEAGLNDSRVTIFIISRPVVQHKSKRVVLFTHFKLGYYRCCLGAKCRSTDRLSIRLAVWYVSDLHATQAPGYCTQ